MAMAYFLKEEFCVRVKEKAKTEKIKYINLFFTE